MLKIKELNKETIVVSGDKVTKTKLKEAIVIRVPESFSAEYKETLYKEIRGVFPEDIIIVVDDTVKFCKLEENNG